MATANAAHSGEFLLGGKLGIHRLGYGAMRITGPGVWGEPADRAEVLRTLRRACELGINFIDTADAYGPDVSELLIREALHPYAVGWRAAAVRLADCGHRTEASCQPEPDPHRDVPDLPRRP